MSSLPYYHHVRREIGALLPRNATRILDVGAGSGATAAWLKTLYPNARTTGVELNRALEVELGRNVDAVLIGGIEDCWRHLQTYDLILVLDVLEHLSDSVGTLRKLSGLLEPKGHVIVSVPNIAHLSVSLPLLFRRNFAYQDAGILDRTHLRFFVEETAVALLNDANLIVTKGIISGLQGYRTKMIDHLSLGYLRHHLAKQYIMLGQLNDSAATQQKVLWGVAK